MMKKKMMMMMMMMVAVSCYVQLHGFAVEDPFDAPKPNWYSEITVNGVNSMKMNYVWPGYQPGIFTYNHPPTAGISSTSRHQQ